MRLIVFAILASIFLIHPLQALAEQASQAKESIDPFLQPVFVDENPEYLRLKKRRQILKVHQGFALTALGLTTAQTVVGQILISRQNQAIFDPTTDALRTTHLALGMTAFTTYATAAGLAIAAPKLPRAERQGSIRWHRGLAWVHGIGMGISPWLGLYTAKQSTGTSLTADQLIALKRTHQVIGYTTLAAMYGAMFVIVFD